MHNSWGQLFKPRKRTGKCDKEHQEPQAEYMRICSDNHFQIYESTEASFTYYYEVYPIHTHLFNFFWPKHYVQVSHVKKQFFEYILKLFGKK